MLGDSQIGTPVNSGDTMTAQQQAGQRWQDEFFRSYSQKHSTAARTDRTDDPTKNDSTKNDSTKNPPFSKIDMLDLFPSPFDIWAQKIDGLDKPPKKPSLTQDGGNKILDAGKKEADVLNIGNDSKEQAQPSPLQRLATTVSEYEAGGSRLTPALRGKFESIIIASDSASPLVPQMIKRLNELRKEGSDLLTPEKKQEVDQTKAALQNAMKELPKDDAKRFSDLAYVRSLAKGDPMLTPEFERQMETIAPGVLGKLKAYEKAVEPLTKIENEFNNVSIKLATELGQNLITRSTYVDLLLKEADTRTAEKYLREAYGIAPSIIENEAFVDMMNRAGLKADDLKKPKMRS